jgi:hypothetical protein
MNTTVLTIISIVLIFAGLSVATYTANREGQLSFLKTAHYVSLFILIAAYILSWIAMTWMANPNKFEIRPKQWIAFAFTLLMAVFWWGRYIFTVADTAETEPLKNIKKN